MFALWVWHIFCVCLALYLSLLSWMQLASFLVIQFHSCGKLSSAHKLSPRRSYSQPRCAVLWAWELAGCLSSVQLSLWCDAPSLPCSSWQVDDPGQCSGPSPGWCALVTCWRTWVSQPGRPTGQRWRMWQEVLALVWPHWPQKWVWLAGGF